MSFFRSRVLVCLIFIPLLAHAHIPLETSSLAPMLAKVMPTVVNITVEKNNPPLADNTPDTTSPKSVGVGSGIIFDAQHGLLVTNAHVIQNEHLIIVTLKDGRHFRAHMMSKDTGFDIAILKIPAKNLQQISFGDSDQLRVGDFVSAIGSPFGLTQTVTSGVISALNRNQPQLEGFQSFIQTDAPINPGNSGGALVDMSGQLIGINTAIITPIDASIGIGFAIPSNMVYSVLTQLLKYGKVERGMLGVVVQDIKPELADVMHISNLNGALVSQIVAGSPAEKSGLRTQDIITSIDGKAIQSAAQLRNTLGLMHPGTKVAFSVSRHGKPLQFTANIGDPNKFQPSHLNPFLSGMRMQNFSELEGDGIKIQGVLVTDISDTSAGTLGGLMPGDVITEANTHTVRNIDDLARAANKAKDQLLLKIFRENSFLFLVLT